MLLLYIIVKCVYCVHIDLNVFTMTLFFKMTLDKPK